MSYLNTIRVAFTYFPVIALIFTIPFILHQYHKYGSINKLRVVIVYSFILYLICIYFLVILPLPNRNLVIKKDNMIRLIPFGFIKDIINDNPFRINNPSTYLLGLTDASIYTVVFNIIMFIPFGIYLRYYFKCNKIKTIIISFLLSLFFELTQLSRLYFIYKYQYRVFDVDDLLMNTIGGLLGYYIFNIFKNILPTRDMIDRKSYLNGMKVSGLRRITLFMMDFLNFSVISINLLFLTNNNYIPLAVFLIYYGLFDDTIFSHFLNVRVIANRIIKVVRIIFLYLYYIIIPIVIINFSHLLVVKLNVETHESIMIYFIVLLVLVIYYLVSIVYLIKLNKIFYDNLFKVRFISTIKGDE